MSVKWVLCLANVLFICTLRKTALPGALSRNKALFLTYSVMPNLTDQYLVLRVIEKQDRAAFDALYQRYASPISRFIFMRVARKEDAEDLTAETFVQAWGHLTRSAQNPGHSEKVNNFRAYIYKIARNEVIDFYRAQGRTPPAVSLDESDDPIDLPDTRQDPLATQIHASDRAYLLACLRRLKDEYREVVALRFFEEMSIPEIAQIVEKTPGNVRVLIHRGLKALRAVVEQSDRSVR